MARVFISYRREDEAHCQRVRDLALRLRSAKIDVIFDEFAKDAEFHGNQPSNGWPLWSIQQAERADSVLVIASDGWFRVFNEQESIEEGHGAAAEAVTVFHRLYKAGNRNEFAAFGVFDPETDFRESPSYLESKCGRFSVGDDHDFKNLLKWLQRPISENGPEQPSDSEERSDPFPESVERVDRSDFVNCDAVFRAWETMATAGAEKRILLVEGDGENGKSTLLAKLFHHAEQALPDHSTALVRFTEKQCPTPDDLLEEFSVELNTGAEGANSTRRTMDLFERRSGQSTVLFFDAYEHTEQQHAYWVDLFLKHARRDPSFRCVVAGRRVPPGQTATWSSVALQATCDALAEPEAFVAYARAKQHDLPAEKIRNFCEVVLMQKKLGIPGASPKLAINLINTLCRQS